jgi:hypothetical protein
MAEPAQWIEGWQKERAQGSVRYILRTGVVAFGGAMLIVNLLMRPPVVFTFLGILVRAVIWGIGGLIFGVGLWFANERRYRKYMSTHIPSSGKNDAA